ncbi:zinc finger [Seminavis robusta]|uniref:Zinc finger n=1 Tax=Seminavis robusta TaxID=568900 RepID=A0A9N8H2R1_9STRA|nr:zinc finger [Seminavis robusta]|eukprot:Sro23_g015810.1 zinc finger (500) ;mRNA; f:77798-79297
MTEYAVPDPLTKLPLRKFEHFRVTTHDAPPEPLSSSTTTTVVACRVCETNHSRYTCPRCGIPYCSVACYQSHNSNSNNDASCTEGFYQERVQSVLQLERKAKVEDTHRMLHRHYHNEMSGVENILQEVSNEEELDTERLMEVLALLELQEESHTGSDQQREIQQQLANLLAKSPNLKSAFEASLERGEVQQLVLQPWDPWWRPVLASKDDDDQEQQTTSTSEGPTLDERLLKVSSFESLLPAAKGGTKRPLPNLTFNLLEVLYWIAHTLRQYHGVTNATADPETAVEAATTLLQSSTVLSKDARYSCLEEVMMSLTQQTKQQQQTLAEDVELIVGHRRMVGRALLEALDIFKAAIIVLKHNNKKHTGTSPDDAGAEESLLLLDLRRKRKKIEFFLSWSQYATSSIHSANNNDNSNNQSLSVILPEQTPELIRAWIDHYGQLAAECDSTDEAEKKDPFVEEFVSAAATVPSSNHQGHGRILHQPKGQGKKTTKKMIEVLD